MKILKVNNHHAAVGRKEDIVEGIVYSNHVGDNSNLEQVIRSRSKNVAGLYNIFGSVQAGTEPTKPTEPTNKNKEELEKYNNRIKNYNIKKANYDLRLSIEQSRVVDKANRILNSIIWTKDNNNKRVIRDNNAIINNLKSSKDAYIKKDTDNLVNFALRGSLYDYRDELKCLLRNIGNANINSSDLQKIVYFLKALKKDFAGYDAKKYARAIQNQNLIVQPNSAGIISLSETKQSNSKEKTKCGNTKDRKEKEKTAFNRFIFEYANVDDKTRVELLGKLYQIVTLFFATPEIKWEKGLKFDTYQTSVTNELKEFDDIWSAHENDKKRQGYFINPPAKLLDAYNNHSALDSKTSKELNNELRKAIKERNAVCYRYAIQITETQSSNLFFEDQALNQFWIHHIEDAVERILDDNNDDTAAQRSKLGDSLFRLELSYLVPKIWKDVINLLSIKYIATGKAVYHFAMESLSETIANQKTDIVLGEINKKLENGLTSFDYEIIKAKETLQRELAVNIAFATNTFARATVDMSKLDDNTSDILLWTKANDCMKYDNQDELLSGILQFFGGRTKWGDCRELIKEYGNENYGNKMFIDMKDMIYSLRNDNFHFSSMVDSKKNKLNNVHTYIFNKELEECDVVEKNRFYSNNLPLFYKESDLEKVMNNLYKKTASRAASIPSFNSVMVRKNFDQLISNELKWIVSFEEKEYRDKWVGGLYYLFKEIYYNEFLQSDDANKLLTDVVNGEQNNCKKEDANYYAINAFSKRFKECKGTLSEKCQQIMTDYNMHNNQHRKARSAYDSIMDKELFKNYPLMLKKCLAKALVKYIESNYRFLKEPTTSAYKKIAVEDFLPNWNSDRYSEIKKKFAEDYYLQKWYFTCHFLPAKSLNLLVGSMRSYIQYVDDVKRRSRNNIYKDDVAYYERIKSAIGIVEICIKLSNTFSNNYKDYFIADDSVEAYADYLSKYINLDTSNMSKAVALKMFGTDGSGAQSNIYTDPENIIANRNITMSKLFGPGEILEQVVKPLTEEDLKKYDNLADKISSYKSNGICNTADEQKTLISYQRIKNRIELRDLVEYGELINDLLGQLIGWSFIRERDLLYFQLGFHYYCLHNDKAKMVEEYKKIRLPNGCTIDNVILRQIMGLYVNGIGVYVRNTEKEIFEEKAIVGGVKGKILAFQKYSMSLGYSEPSGEKGDLYDAGLELFENIKEHTEVIKIRNYIDHFKYYVKKDYSLLQLYSEVFDRFFTYDMKYHKSVVNVLENILLKYNVIATPSFITGKKNYDDELQKNSAKIVISQLKADRFEYKLADGKQIKIDAKSSDYLGMVQSILYLYEDEGVSKPRIKTVELTEEKPNSDSNQTVGKQQKNNNQQQTSRDKNNTDKFNKYSNSGSINSMAGLFSNIKLDN